jgi:hypothetical protein
MRVDLVRRDAGRLASRVPRRLGADAPMAFGHVRAHSSTRLRGPVRTAHERVREPGPASNTY